jgi:hypothetical protein
MTRLYEQHAFLPKATAKLSSTSNMPILALGIFGLAITGFSVMMLVRKIYRSPEQDQECCSDEEVE